MHRKRRGFALGIVLIVMILLIALSAVIMDLTTNYAATSRSVVEREELFNAAQSGIEWGKAWLLENRQDMILDKLSAVDELSDLKARIDDGSVDGDPHPDYPNPDPDITVDVGIYYCNYVIATGVDPVAVDLPPVYEQYGASGSGSGGSGIGTSGFIDPNRNLLGFGETGSVFVVRSEATFENKSTELETMVVVKND